jgi:DNA-binding transcriptional MocR family regulator
MNPVSGYGITGRNARQIAESIERGIAEGTLPPGSALPPIRDLATNLAVNPNTVSAAYRQLRERGSITTDGRRGSRVRARPATSPRRVLAPAPPGARDVSTGFPDPALLPRPRPRAPRTPVLYGAAPILPALRDAAAARLNADQVPTDHLTMTFGALDGIERVLRAHLRPGDHVAVEDPGWPHLLDTLAALNLRPVPVALDDEGPQPDALREALRRPARALVVTGRAQNPTGAAISAARAADLRAILATRPDVVLIEDDHAAELATEPASPLSGATHHWAYLRSASKVYGPDLRAAVLAADATTTARVEGAMAHGARWVPHLLQTTLLDLWHDQTVTALVTRARTTYAARRAALLTALTARGISAHGREGLNVWVPVPDEATAVSRLQAAGWIAAPGGPFRLHAAPAIRLTTACLPEPDAPALAEALTDALTGPDSSRI